MIQLIFPLDSIDDGRKKINNLLFTGFTPYGYWSTLNSGNTGISMEFSATSSNNLLNNKDTSSSSNNLIIGNENIISGSGGYNFIQGKSNYLASSKNSFIFGNDNNLTGLTNSFISGENLKIYSGNNLSILGCEDLIISSNTTNNNFLTLISNYKDRIEGKPSSSDKKIIFLTAIGNSATTISADCQYVTLLNGANNIVSGDAKNVLILGSNNKIGYNQLNSTTKTYQDIYIFGDSLSPILSADTSNTPLSGTYINDLCIENELKLQTEAQVLTNIGLQPRYAGVNFNRYNSAILIGGDTFSPATLNWTISATTTYNSTLSGFYLLSYYNTRTIKSISGDTNYFADSYNGANNNRWDIPSNYLSGNTVFMVKSGFFGQGYLKIKG